METWQMLVGLTAMLILYAVVSTVTGRDLTAIDLVAALVFGSLGLYLGKVLSDRLTSGGE